ncbi:MAG: NAD-dependent epimerase/dehydratase family protein [Candidatus Paceibacterota bacterium]
MKSGQKPVKTRVLVTGGAGFIGSHLVDCLVSDGYKVAVIDNLSTGNRKNLNPRAKFYKLDIANKKVDEVFHREKPEIVFHLAAQVDLQKSILDPVADAKTNILGFINICKNCKKYGVKKIVFSSSAAVYGDNGCIPAKEDSPLQPVSPYGVAKLTAENLLDIYQKQFGIDYVALRYSNVYGPKQGSNGEGGVVSIFFKKAKSGEKLCIYGNGEQTRDFIYVDDVVGANLSAIQGSQTGIFNISTAKETSINELFEIVNNLVGGKATKQYLPARSGDQARSALDYSKAAQFLSWRSKYTLQEGLSNTSKWFLRTKKA